VSQKQFFAHIGMHKTASTFLQKNIFPAFENIHYIKKHDYFKKDTLVKRSSSQKFLFTNECESSQEDRIERLHRLFPHSKIILVLRRHDRWITSKYKYSLRKGKGLTFREYYDCYYKPGQPNAHELQFMHTISVIQKYFPTPPLILFHEEIVKNPQAVVDLLAEYMGVSVNKKKLSFSRVNAAFSEKQLQWLFRYNRFFYRQNQKKDSRKGVMKKLRLKALTRHMFVALAHFFPSRANFQPLVETTLLSDIRKLYEDDWNDAQNYAALKRLLLF